MSQLAAGGNATRLFEGVLRLETANLPCTGELENCAAEPFYKSSQSTVPAPCVQMGGIQPRGWVGQGTEQGTGFLVHSVLSTSLFVLRTAWVSGFSSADACRWAREDGDHSR